MQTLKHLFSYRLILSLSLITFFTLLPDGYAADREGARSSVRLLNAHYMPDPAPPEDSQAVEGYPKPSDSFGLTFAPLQRLYSEYADFGGMRLTVRNLSEAAVEIEGVLLNGKPIEEQYVHFDNDAWDERGVTWYRMRPERIQPNRAGELYIRFRRRPPGTEADISLELSDGTRLQTEVPYIQPALQVDYVTMDEDFRKLYIYVRRLTASELGGLQEVTLDGLPVENVEIYGAGFPGNVALAVAELSEPLQLGDYHVAGAKTGDGFTTAAQFKVTRPIFVRTAMQWLPESAEEVEELGFNMVCRRHLSAEKAEEYGVYHYSPRNPYDAYDEPEEAPRLHYNYEQDEPDAKYDARRGDFGPEHAARFMRDKIGFDGDKMEWETLRHQHYEYSGLRWAVGLGRFARDYIEGTTNHRMIVENEWPQVNSFMVVNGTTRPLNFHVYGQLLDIIATDPYPVNYYGGDLSTVREQYILMRQAAIPRPTYACLEAFTWDRFLEESPDTNRRAPTAEEFHQMAVQALGSGVKGYTSWFWATGSGMSGAGHIPHLREAYIRLNHLTRHIEDELILGVPVDAVENDAGLTEVGPFFYFEEGDYHQADPWMKERVWTSALQCGPEAMVITAAHHIPASRMSHEYIEPTRDVTITVDLPEFMNEVVGYEVDADGLEPYSVKIENGQARIVLDQITDGRVFLLRTEE